MAQPMKKKKYLSLPIRVVVVSGDAKDQNQIRLMIRINDDNHFT